MIGDALFRTVTISLTVISIVIAGLSAYFAHDSRNIGLENLTIQKRNSRPSFAITRIALDNPFDEKSILRIFWTNVSGRTAQQAYISAGTANPDSGVSKILGVATQVNPAPRDVAQNVSISINRTELLGTIVVCAVYTDSDSNIFRDSFFFQQPTQTSSQPNLTRGGGLDLVAVSLDNFQKLIALRLCDTASSSGK